VSAAFLHRAAGGRAVPQLARYVQALARGRVDDAVVQDLDRVGATSGAALARGARAGLRVAGLPVAGAGTVAEGGREVA
jgi:hypothetical protein